MSTPLNPAQLDLETRSGLPDALRVLLEIYPRDAWEQDPGFTALLRFWLDRHLMFRDLMDRMTLAAQSTLDGDMDPGRHAAALSRFGGVFLNGLHEHHTIEDAHYFPKLIGHDARLETGFGMLEADHDAIERHLETFAEDANAILREGATGNRDALGRFIDRLSQSSRLLDRHLTDEEELVVPVILKYGEGET